ncbi:MAG: intradiol ring-cleavage dioxygenase [Solirubrobacteraceae bacterium]|nr:intradiol ring-cleavage dioxygenase [Solirubrobacteraceae bacterium]
MDRRISESRALVSRRRLLAVGGSIGIGTLLAACGSGSNDGAAVTTGAPGDLVELTTPSGTATIQPSTAARSDVIALLDKAQTCTLSNEETQGPYWFDVDAIRSDITEDRPGIPLDLALRVHDPADCDPEGTPKPVRNAVVEIWHCDAGGMYSGFESGSAGAGGGPPRGGEGTIADGSYAEGDAEAATTDDGTYLRGAQVADRNGIVQFETIYPGWYPGRTVHIHVKVHVNRTTVLTTQLYFDEDTNAAVMKTEPYADRSGRDTFNDGDGIYDASGLATTQRTAEGHLAVLNLGIDV